MKSVGSVFWQAGLLMPSLAAAPLRPLGVQFVSINIRSMILHVREQRVRASIRRIKGLLPKFSPRPSIHREQQELRMPTTVSSANVPPFTHESAVSKVRAAEDAWNTRDPRRVCLGYTIDSRWRNRAEFVNGREEIIAFLTRKWSRELEYSLIKELWAFGAKMARTNCSRREIEELLGGAIRQ
jgi:uncharacterized protein DUF1348